MEKPGEERGSVEDLPASTKGRGQRVRGVEPSWEPAVPGNQSSELTWRAEGLLWQLGYFWASSELCCSVCSLAISGKISSCNEVGQVFGEDVAPTCHSQGISASGHI